MHPIERFRKLPLEVETVLWDGNPERASFLQHWTGQCPDGSERFRRFGEVWSVWADEERTYIQCPVGHRVVRTWQGTFYPISPESVAATYEVVSA